MIDFPCACGTHYSLPDSMAGQSFQCDACGRLVVVPPMEDLQRIRPDGTYEMDGPPPLPVAQEQIRVATQVIAVQTKPPPPPPAPAVKKISAPVSKPVAPEKLEPPPPDAALYALDKMFSSRSFLVLALMTAIHVFLAFDLFFVTDRGPLFYIVPAAVIVVCLGFYSLIVQETGPGESDELPTPMRNFEFGPDIWQPFTQCAFVVFLCVMPIFFFGHLLLGLPGGPSLVTVFLLADVAVMPALLLTTSTGAVLENYHPAVLWRVIRLGGRPYFWATAAWVLGGALLRLGEAGFYQLPFAWSAQLPPEGSENAQSAWLAVFELPAGLFFQYYACWVLGLIWRRRHKEFGWVKQQQF
jgi:hypothetical protein